MNIYPIHGSEYFDIREFVDPRTWSALKIQAACQVDPKTVACSDLLRRLAGRANVINNWHYAKPGETIYDASGFRAIWEPVGGTLSQHRGGRASDNKVKGMTSKQMFEVVMDNQALFEAAGLTTIEDPSFTVGWLHLDCRPKIKGWHPDKGFLIVKP